jgi:glycosyltransferase involved in cell wall biosynthesis
MAAQDFALLAVPLLFPACAWWIAPLSISLLRVIVSRVRGQEEMSASFFDGEAVMSHPALSVILPTRDRAGLLEDCLVALTRQEAVEGGFEVIVVDNGSRDATAEVAQRYAAQLPLRYVFAPEPGLHVGRHAGLKAAQADILVFGDDDIVPASGWLQAIAAAFREPEVALVGGNNLPLFETDPPRWLARWWEQAPEGRRALDYLSILDWGSEPVDIDPGLVWGCNYSIRRDVLMAVGGFHPDGVPEDRLRFRGDGETAVSDGIRQRGLRSRFIPGASVLHRVSAGRMTPEYFARRARAQGVSDSYSDLRASGGRPSFSIRSRRISSTCLRAGRAWLSSGWDADGRALAGVRVRCAIGYLMGYAYHQKEFARDPVLREWVLKEHYLT